MEWKRDSSFRALARTLGSGGTTQRVMLFRGSKRATRLTVATAVGIWVLAGLLAVPAYIGSYLRGFDVNPTVQFFVCYPYPEEWGMSYAQAMVLLRFLMYYSLPLTVIALFYVLMARHLVLSARNVPGEMQGTQRQMRARRKVALTVLAFVLVFAACFLPSHVFTLWFYYNPTAEEEYNGWWHALRIIGFCLSFLNSCVNPIALYCTSGIFRKYFNRYLLCRRVPSHGTRSSLSLSTSRRLHSSRKTNISMVPRTVLSQVDLTSLLERYKALGRPTCASRVSRPGACEPPHSRRSSPSIDTRNLRGVTSALPTSWVFYRGGFMEGESMERRRSRKQPSAPQQRHNQALREVQALNQRSDPRPPHARPKVVPPQRVHPPPHGPIPEMLRKRERDQAR
ncbi:Neuropeptide CCHamide-1 receptor [Eumeta japonica]|uniref:Neuropeptide CCHamide-1 receptor n=1 Tax=Eumeta variegata TaxID=151549 RepID=A0A4C1X978_EUMVA|nr:Neuropeptide CCHamide-1 receptor [Eumeta japonica]